MISISGETNCWVLGFYISLKVVYFYGNNIALTPSSSIFFEKLI